MQNQRTFCICVVNLVYNTFMGKTCLVCSKPIPDGRGKGNYDRVKYCSDECLKLSIRGGQDPLSKQWGIPKSSVGAFAELMVCADLLKMGWEVFRAVSPCGCDLSVWRDGVSYRVEVKTGYVTSQGKLHHSGGNNARGQSFDVLAVVTSDGIIYDPNVFTLESNKLPS